MENLNEKLMDGFNMDNYDYEPTNENSGFSIIEPISEKFAARLTTEIKNEWEADFELSNANSERDFKFVRTPFNPVAHADCKAIGDSVSEVAYRAEGRARTMRNCPLLAQARQNSLDAEKRLKMARFKDYPTEAKPEDQYKHLDVSIDLVRDAVNEFLSGCDVSSKAKEFMSAETLFKQGNASNEVMDIRTAVKACVYAYITHTKAKTAEIFGAKELQSFNEPFLDWYYNYQHYSLSPVHVHFSDLLQIILEKSLTRDN